MAKTQDPTLEDMYLTSNMVSANWILRICIFYFMENSTSFKPLLYSYLETAFQLSSVVKKVFSVQNHVQSFRSSSLFKATVKV